MPKKAKIVRLARSALVLKVTLQEVRNVQTAAKDMFLRLIRDLPGSLQYLRKHAA